MDASLPTPRSRFTRRGCLSLAGRAFLGLVILSLALTPVGLAYQAYALRQDQHRFPPPGRLVDVGGYKLHIVCQGEGSPTVVLESGLGDGGFIWEKVMSPVARVTRVCAYDRPGFGWSDFVAQPFYGPQVAGNLHALLNAAGIPGPYLLVGHSMGGLYVREFAWQYPNETAGLVFVDSVHENQSRSVEGGRGGMASSLGSLLSICSLLAPTGVFRFFGLAESLVKDTGLSNDVRSAAIATLNRNTYCKTIANELATSDVDVSRSAKPQSLGNIPLIVLVAGLGIGEKPGEGPPGMSEDQKRQFDTRWMRLQKELAGLSTRGRLIIAENSGHYIHLEQPQLVIDTILELVAVTRREASFNK